MSREHSSTSGKSKVVALDHSDAGLNDVCKLLQGIVDVVPLRDWDKAKKVLHADAAVIAVLVDQMFGGGALDVLDQIRTLRPKVRRVMLTPAGELAGLLEGLHSGVIERVVYKPLDRRELVSSFFTAMPAQVKKIA